MSVCVCVSVCVCARTHTQTQSYELKKKIRFLFIQVYEHLRRVLNAKIRKCLSVTLDVHILSC
jgi:hypothetical protein